MRNSELLKEQDIVQCQNPQCTASYVTQIKDGEFTFEPYQLSLECKSCGHVAYFDANIFLQMKPEEYRTFSCEKCGTRHLVRWLLRYGLESEALKEEE